MSRVRGSATLIVAMIRAPAAPIDATAHYAPTSAASVPASMLPSVRTTELMCKMAIVRPRKADSE
jgi:hypothetical protein